MNRFGHDCTLSPYEDGVTWWLYWPLVYYGARGAIRVPRSFDTDLASTPREFWGVIPPWGKYGRAAIIHDWLYWIQCGTRREADGVLLSAMQTLDVPRWQRLAIYYAVRLFGWLAWRDNARLASEGFSRMHNSGARRPPWQRKRIRSAITPATARE